MNFIHSNTKGVKSTRRISSKKAFTLIELLVVISIIAILAAVLFPVFAQAKEAAKKAACLSNIKQIALGWIMYSNDYDDLMPRPGLIYETDNYSVPGYYNAPYTTWAYANSGPPSYVVDTQGGMLFPYMKNTQIQDCPVGQSLLSFSEGDPSYGVNNRLVGPFNSLNIPLGTSFSSVELPAETLLMADAALIFPVAPYDIYKTDIVNTCGIIRLQARHTGKANTSWLDGHAKTNSIDAGTGDPNSIPNSVVTDNNLGDILKFAREGDGTCPSVGQDPFYYDLTKP